MAGHKRGSGSRWLVCSLSRLHVREFTIALAKLLKSAYYDLACSNGVIGIARAALGYRSAELSSQSRHTL